MTSPNTLANYGIQNDLILSTLTLNALNMSEGQGKNGDALVSDGLGGTSFTFAKTPRLVAESAAQTTNVAFLDHVKFNVIKYNSTNNQTITMDTTTPFTATYNQPSVGRWTLKGGHSYIVYYVINNVLLNAPTAKISVQILDADSGLGISWHISTGTIPAGTTARAPISQFYILTPTVDTRYEISFQGDINVIVSMTAFVDISQLS